MTTASCAARPAPTATDNIITVAELRAGGMSERAILTRCRPGGPWRRLMPGIVLLGPGEPTRQQILRAATMYLGKDGVVTGVDALAAHGLELPLPRTVHVLVPAYRRILPPNFILLERTARPPDPVLVNGLPFAPPARAALDAARKENDADQLRDLLSLPIYYGLSDIEELQSELDAGNQRGSAAVRAELRRISRNRDTFVHGLARQLVRRSPLPPPRWDVTVCDLRGRPIGAVDAWWDEVGMGWQFTQPRGTNPERHLGHLALTAAGVVLLRTPTERLRVDGDVIVKELASAFRAAATRTRPLVQCEMPVVAA
ncbi:hypothetical protein DI005_34970 [Prauserella sp. PE36]|uniref:hypothetical protein n=1 Tax=Prauserella sp. PE36 TaxID=1504709 RepID=UPI000DE50F3B|nr:hypothetical protein [Prauserella sp. PE36]RBM10893.1 hypothetical protein DI005_34970 [Prauserella sp. PE36]